MEKAAVFEQTYRNYLSQAASLDFDAIADILGIRVVNGTAEIDLFSRPYYVSGSAITDAEGRRPIHGISVVLCKYLLMCPPAVPPAHQWVAFRDFPDAAPFVGAFANNPENAVAGHFSGRAGQLAAGCQALNGSAVNEGLSYDVAMQVPALPRIPLMVLFNDADADFPAQCSVLFEQRAAAFLDMECLAILGWLLADYLKQINGSGDGVQAEMSLV